MGEAFVEVRRRVGYVGVLAAVLSSTSAASAQQEPVVGTTADTALTGDASAAEESVVPFEPGPSGPLLGAGVLLNPDGGAIAFRADAGMTLSSSERTDIRLLAVLSFGKQSLADTLLGAEGDIETYSLAPFLTLQYVRTVVPRQSGRFALLGELGAGPIFAWIKSPDRAFEPSHWENEVRPGGRIAVAAEYRANRGWFAAVQPAGAMIAVIDGDPEASFELGLRAGYQSQ
jgi:hypothetical protein